MSDVLEHAGVDIHRLLLERISDWNQKLAPATEAILAKQHTIKEANSRVAEFRACAGALMGVVAPYRFSKKESKLFVDHGHLGRPNNYLVGASFMPEEAIGNRYMNIGMVDYWAAALVDKGFAGLCRQRIVLNDRLIDTRDCSAFDFYDTHGLAKSGDVPAGGFEQKFGDSLRVLDTWNYPRELMGARNRVTKDLSKRFAALLQDPVQGERIKKARDFFMNTLDKLAAQVDGAYQQTGKLGGEVEDATSDLEHDKDKTLRLAYLESLGHRTIDIPKNNNLWGAVHGRVSNPVAINGVKPKPYLIDCDRYDMPNKPVVDSLERTMGAENGMIPLNLPLALPAAEPPSRETLANNFMGEVRKLVEHGRA
jgi:hypothetical protein